jgi:tetratricopeptide (TPR) repeat protein
MATRSARSVASLTFAFLLGPILLSAQSPQDLVDRAEVAFAEGRFADSVALFDELARLVPDAAPTLWQRGIALYELGRFPECASQFASFHALDPTDLENASWHLLCAARAGSLEKARGAALRAGPDPRIMRSAVYAALLGRITAENLVELAETSVDVAHFYGYLYAGLLREVQGDRIGAVEYLTVAASDRYRSHGGFMNVVARVHLDQLRRRADR